MKNIPALSSQFYCKKIFSPEECSQILKAFEHQNFLTVQVDLNNDIFENLSIRNTKLKAVQLDGKTEWIAKKITEVKAVQFSSETEWILKKIADSINVVNNKYYNFQISYLNDIQILKYEIDGHYGWHMDLGTSINTSTRKLSFVLFLSSREDYEGGQLVFRESQSGVDQEQGSMAIFPSYLYHKVEPVISGTRITMVGWVCGNSDK